MELISANKTFKAVEVFRNKLGVQFRISFNSSAGQVGVYFTVESYFDIYETAMSLTMLNELVEFLKTLKFKPE